MHKIFIKIIFGFFLIFICLYGYFFFFAQEKLDIGNITILDRNQEIIAQIGQKDGLSLPYSGSLDIPLIQSILTIEDKRFYEHFGTDILAKSRSIFNNINNPNLITGGSTITEQYVKNIYFPGSSRNILQKIQEAILAETLEMKLSKEAILRKYLDTVYMGNGIYGIQSASINYFGKSDLGELTPSEITEIITRIHAPNISTETKNYQKKVSEKLFRKAIDEDFHIAKGGKIINKNPLLMNRILDEKKKYCQKIENNLSDFLLNIPKDICENNHLILQTSIDQALSEDAGKIMEGIVTPLESENIKNAAVYIRENKTEKILVYLGNRSESTQSSQIDMIQARRSVGSVLKPFVYKLAFENGNDGESLILDDTRIYETDDPIKKYIPENYVPKSYGPIRLKEALGNSLNSATVRLSEKLGIGNIADFYKKNNLDLDHDAGYYGYGISLGAVELTLENVVKGYENLSDLSEKENFLLFQVLSSGANRAKTFGYTSILGTSIPMAVKTGTSTDFRDNWTVGYTSDITIGVWIGNADGSSMQDVSGVTGAGPIFHQIAEKMIEKGYIKNEELKIPNGIIETYRCLDRTCFQKEHVYEKTGIEHKSFLGENLYFESDFSTPLTKAEKTKWNIQ